MNDKVRGVLSNIMYIAFVLLFSFLIVRFIGAVELGEDEYFVLGDNREISLDSRYKEVGSIPRSIIIGRAWVRLYPFNEFGLLTGR